MNSAELPSAAELHFAYTREKAARKESELVLQTKTRELYNANEELKKMYVVLQQHQRATIQQEKLAALGTLTAGMAHEINNPLAYVMSNLQILNDYFDIIANIVAALDSDNVVDKDYLAAVYQKETKRYPSLDLNGIVKDGKSILEDSEGGLKRVKQIVLSLKDYSRQDDTQRTKQSINESIKSAITILSNEIKNKCDLTLELNECEPMFYSGNTMMQIFINLISNAIQAFADNQRGKIIIKSVQEYKRVIVSVEDNGCGMSEETLPNIFLPFFTTKPLGIGTGLGLSICYEKIKEMGGSIDVSSTLGKGTCFTLTFITDQRSKNRITLD